MTDNVLTGITPVTRINIGDMVTINTETREITYHDGYMPDAAAKIFWEALANF